MIVPQIGDRVLYKLSPDYRNSNRVGTVVRSARTCNSYAVVEFDNDYQLVIHASLLTVLPSSVLTRR